MEISNMERYVFCHNSLLILIEANIVGKTVHSLKSQTNIKLGNTSIFCVRQGSSGKLQNAQRKA
jgi:hypothetical protein